VGKRAVAGYSKVRRQLEQEQDVRARARAMKTRAMLCGEAGRSPDAGAGDEGDQALVSVQERLEHVELLRISSSLHSVEAALRTLDIGRYGVCQHCEERIPARRLRALPTAILCRECQEAAEEVRAACRACAPDRQPAVSASARRLAPSGRGSHKEHTRLTPS
jgi:DnaK suppressor protein